MVNQYFFSTNLKYLRLKNGIEQQELAEKLGRRSGSTISDWERGKVIPQANVLNQLSTIFNVSLTDLMTIDLTNQTSSSPNILEVNKLVKIPILGKIACGDPIDAIENVSEYRVTPSETLPSGEMFYLEATGNSMEPKVPDGSLVLCRKQEDVESGEIAAVLVNGDQETTLKKVIKQGNTILLQPLNESYAPYVVNKDNPARIVGKAIKVEVEL